ncbi:MAG: tail fiber domain-containing protein, partial [Acidobacteria bacterium]
VVDGTRFLHRYGSQNTFVGEAAGNFTTTGNSNTGVGSNALNVVSGGSGNTAVGATALAANGQGADNAAAGTGALGHNSYASANTAVGARALATQSYHMGFEVWSTYNTAVGYEALFSNELGDFNPYTGRIPGSLNTGLGADALRANVSGSYNTAVGGLALHAQTSGDSNTAVGQGALASLGTGSGNVGIGSGAGGSGDYSNRLYIANTTARTLIWGDFALDRVAINDTAATDTLDVNGTLRVRAWSSGSTGVCKDANGVLANCSSDSRLKVNVVPLGEEVDVLPALDRIHGVAFDWDRSQDRARDLGDARQIGLLAQEVETVLPHVVATAPDGYKSLDYSGLTAFLVEVARAQQTRIEALRLRLEEKDRLLDSLLVRLRALEQQPGSGPGRSAEDR